MLHDANVSDYRGLFFHSPPCDDDRFLLSCHLPIYLLIACAQQGHRRPTISKVRKMDGVCVVGVIVKIEKKYWVGDDG